jgi:hypothetical protein
MAVYRPKYKDPKTGTPIHSAMWWYEFTFAGRRVRESAKTTRKTVAIEAEKHRRRTLNVRTPDCPSKSQSTVSARLARC